MPSARHHSARRPAQHAGGQRHHARSLLGEAGIGSFNWIADGGLSVAEATA